MTMSNDLMDKIMHGLRIVWIFLRISGNLQPADRMDGPSARRRTEPGPVFYDSVHLVKKALHLHDGL